MIIPKNIQDLELSPKFTEWRLHQKQTIFETIQAFNDGKKFVVLRAGTGFGKSLTGIAIAKIMNLRTYYIVSTKQLQQQVVDDFPFIKKVLGRQNFQCIHADKLQSEHRDTSCDPGYYCGMNKKCPSKSQCKYQIQRKRAIQSQYSILNYPFYLIDMNYTKQFNTHAPAGLIILDEADVGEDHLMDFVNVKLKNKIIGELGYNPLTVETKFEEFHGSLECLSKDIERNIADALLDSRKRYGRQFNMSELTNQLKTVGNLLLKVRLLVDHFDDTWIIERDNYGVSFKPTYIDQFSGLLFDHSPRYIMMSATIDPVLIEKTYGIAREDCHFIDIPCTFPKENRRVLASGVVNMSYNTINTELPKLVKWIDILIDQHPHKKTVIHAVNYRICKYVLENSKHKHRFISHTTKNREEVLEKFKKDPGLILVSPSMERGVSFDGDLCELSILCKTPYLSLGDEQVKRRCARDSDWYQRKTANRFMQICGRGVRSETDECLTVILDRQFNWFLKRNKGVFPEWFLDAVEVK
jgi:Rad3-related DNA helicase